MRKKVISVEVVKRLRVWMTEEESWFDWQQCHFFFLQSAWTGSVAIRPPFQCVPESLLSGDKAVGV
jgi:hypothetical protein